VEQLERILEKQRVAAAPVRQHHAALVHHDNGREGEVDILLVRYGRFEESISCSVPPTPDEKEHLYARCASVFGEDTTPPDAFSKRDATEIRLLSHWTYAHRDELTAVRWESASSPSDLVCSIETQIGKRRQKLAS
jgi:DNA polymerase-3 subunit epsilon